LKKILVIFLLMVGIYIGYINMHKIDGLPFGKQSNQADVTKSTKHINMDLTGISATIIPENRDNLQADLKGKGKLTVKESGDRISVQYKRIWFDWLPFLNHSKLTIYIPKSYNRNLEIDSGSANLLYNGSGTELNRLAVKIGSGNVNLKNLKVNRYEHKGSSGNANITSLETKTGTFDLSSGNIRLMHYIGKLNGDLSSGNFNVQMDQLTNDIKVNVSSGKVKLDLPKNADFTLNGDVSSGSISNNFPLKNQSNNGKHIKGTHGSGHHDIDLDVSSGNISIY
jgi:lia operon protein LiaG